MVVDTGASEATASTDEGVGSVCLDGPKVDARLNLGILGLFFALKLNDLDTPLRPPFQLVLVGLVGVSGIAPGGAKGNSTSWGSAGWKGSVWRKERVVVLLELKISLVLAIESFAEWLLTLESSQEVTLELVVIWFLCRLNVLDLLRDDVRVDTDDDLDDLDGRRIVVGRERVGLMRSKELFGRVFGSISTN